MSEKIIKWILNTMCKKIEIEQLNFDNPTDVIIGNSYDSYLCEDPKVNIINIHGGGFITGDKSYNRFYCNELRKYKTNVYSLNYDTRNGIKASIQSIMDVITEICELNNIHEIILNGESAGAYLATLIACVFASNKYANAYEVKVPNIKVKGLMIVGTTCSIHTFPKLLLPLYYCYKKLILNHCNEIEDYTVVDYNILPYTVVIGTCERDTYYKKIKKLARTYNNIEVYYVKNGSHCFNVFNPYTTSAIELNKDMINCMLCQNARVNIIGTSDGCVLGSE